MGENSIWEEDAHRSKENEDDFQSVGGGTRIKAKPEGEHKTRKGKTEIIDKLPGRERR